MARRRERPRPRGGGGCGLRPGPGAAGGPRGPSAPALGPRRADRGVPGRAGRLLAPRGSGGRSRPAAEAERGAVLELGAVMAVCARVCPGHCRGILGPRLSPDGPGSVTPGTFTSFSRGVWQGLPPKRGEPVPSFGAGGRFAHPTPPPPPHYAPPPTTLSPFSRRAAGPLTL